MTCTTNALDEMKLYFYKLENIHVDELFLYMEIKTTIVLLLHISYKEAKYFLCADLKSS